MGTVRDKTSQYYCRMMRSFAQAQSTHTARRGGLVRTVASGIAAVSFILLLVCPLSADAIKNGRGDGCSDHAHVRHCEPKDKSQDKIKDKKSRPQRESADVRQRALLTAAVERLAPQRPGATDLYTIGVAGWADQDVFIKE